MTTDPLPAAPAATIDGGATIGVVGASARAAAFSLLRAGYRVVAADLFADADLGQHCPAHQITDYPTGFVDWLDKSACDAWLYTGALENYPELVDQLAGLRPMIGHVGECLRQVRDPLALQATLRFYDFAFPETLASSAAKTDGGSWIRKTYRGSSGSGVGVDENAPYLQRRVEGRQLSAVFDGAKLLGVTQQLVGESWTGASDFQYCGSIGPYPLSDDNTIRIHDLGRMLSASFRLTGLYGVDLIDDGEVIWTIEVNPRYTAAIEVVERSCGIPAINPTSQPEAGVHCGKVILFAKRPLQITEKLCEQLLQQAGGLPWPDLADIPKAGTRVPTGQPILSLFATGDSSEDVRGRLQQGSLEIEAQIDQAAT